MTDFSGFDVFSEKAAVADADRVQLLDPELVYPDPENVRSEIDPAKIDEMAETIKERGQLQPITVAPKDADGRYRIMFGERRWRACKQLGVQVRAIVSKTDDIEQVRHWGEVGAARYIGAQAAKAYAYGEQFPDDRAGLVVRRVRVGGDPRDVPDRVQPVGHALVPRQ